MNTHHSTDSDEAKLFIVYDAITGDITHFHEVVVLPGAKELGVAEMERDVLKHAGRATGKDLRNMQVLHVEEKSMTLNKHYRVDVETKKLVALDES
jgi:hypothetical protein